MNAFIENLRAEQAEWRRQHGKTRRERLEEILATGKPAEVPEHADDPTGPALMTPPKVAKTMLRALDVLSPTDAEDWARLPLPECWRQSRDTLAEMNGGGVMVISLSQLADLLGGDGPDKAA